MYYLLLPRATPQYRGPPGAWLLCMDHISGDTAVYGPAPPRPRHRSMNTSPHPASIVNQIALIRMVTLWLAVSGHSLIMITSGKIGTIVYHRHYSHHSH